MSTVRLGELGDGKIQGWQRDRLAVVYVRQSSRQQVVDHGESTRLQYGLVDRAGRHCLSGRCRLDDTFWRPAGG